MKQRPIVFMFSGQGSQYYQMGKELFRQSPFFQQWMIHLDERVQSLIGESVVKELYEPQKRVSDPFERTDFTHPAIFMVEYALAQTLIASGVHPDCVLGTSMGEFAAAAVAGVITPDDALKLLIDQAQLLETRCERGAMLAVIHNQSLYEQEPLLYNNSELASVNFESHFVLAGPRDKLLAIEKHLKQQGIVCGVLPVQQAFHSSLIDPAGHFYRMILKGHSLATPRIPFMSGALGTRLSQLPDSYLWDVVREPIQLPKALKELESVQPHVYLDIGPAGTLANFVKRNIARDSQSESFATMTQFNQDIKNVNLIIEAFASAQSAQAPTTAFSPSSTPTPRPTPTSTPTPRPTSSSTPTSRPTPASITTPAPASRPTPERTFTPNPAFAAAQVIERGSKLTAYVFPGQGSQKVGMGDTLFDEFAELTARADAVLGYSIKELCLNDPDSVLSKTQYTQPALYVVNALSYLKKVQETGSTPDFVAGHSLGEYNALFAAGAFDFETGLRLVKKRGELMSQAFGGGMAAVIGFSQEQVQQVLLQNGLHNIDIANDNSPGQVVIAGLKDDVVSAKPYFEAAGVKHFVHLNVSGAFHSRYMAEAARSFAEHLNAFTLSPLMIPVISNVDARPYLPDETKQNLVRQITSQVKWNNSVRYLLGLGEMEITEVGPGNVLTKLVTTIRNEAQPLVNQ